MPNTDSIVNPSDVIEWSEYTWPPVVVTYSTGQRIVNLLGPAALGIAIGVVLGYVLVAVLGG